MPRWLILASVIGAAALGAFWLLLQTPGTVADAFAHPLTILTDTGITINSTLLEASEFGDPIRAAGQKLLQPFGFVRLVRTLDIRDSDVKKH